MAKSNQKYWNDRWQVKDDLYYNNAEDMQKELKKAYKASIKELENKLAAFITKYSKDKELSYEETQFIMNKSQRANFKYSISEYVKRIEESGSAELLKELNVMAGKSRFRAIDELITDIKVQADLLHTKELKLTEDLLGLTYEDNYYRVGYEIQAGNNYIAPFGKLKVSTIEAAINYPWSGDDFSSNIWNNKDKLVKKLRSTVTKGLIQGKSYDAMAKDMQKAMGTSYFNANRITMTETSYVISKSDMESFNEIELERYINIATLDIDTSEICQKQDGKTYPVKDYSPGTNAPPFHPHCRTKTAPYVGEDQLEGRIGRGKNDKSQAMSKDIKTYKDWAKWQGIELKWKEN